MASTSRANIDFGAARAAAYLKENVPDSTEAAHSLQNSNKNAVLIVYAGVGKALVRELAKELTGRQLAVIVGHGVQGHFPENELTKAARTVRVAVVVLSAEFIRSNAAVRQLGDLISRAQRLDVNGKVNLVLIRHTAVPWNEKALSDDLQNLLHDAQQVATVLDFEGDDSGATLKRITNTVIERCDQLDEVRTDKSPEKGVAVDGEVSLPSELLQSKYEIVPFLGMSEHLEDFVAWTNSNNVAGQVRVLYGPGGSGKSRLAQELCAQLRECGVLAGFLKITTTAADLARLISSGQPSLAVVDDADSCHDLHSLLRPIAELVNSNSNMRILLIARSAGDWYHAAASKDVMVSNLLRAHASLRIHICSPDPELVDRHFCAARHAFAGHLNQAVVLTETNPTLLEDWDPRYKQILYIHASALASQLRLPAVTADVLLESLLRHEERMWVVRLRATFRSLVVIASETALLSQTRQVVAFATLRGGLRSAAEVMDLLKPPMPRILIEAWSAWLHEMYPGPGPGSIAPMAPHLLGDILVHLTLARSDNVSKLLLDLFADDDPDALQAALLVLARLSVDHDDVIPWITTIVDADVSSRGELAVFALLSLTGDDSARLGKRLAEYFAEKGTLQLAYTVCQLLPLQSAAAPWRDIAVWAARAVGDASGANRTIARQALEKSRAESALGHVEASHLMAMEAVQLARAVVFVEETPGLDHVITLIECLTNLGNRFSDIGEYKSAKLVHAEGLELSRSLAASTEDRFVDAVADSASGLGNVHGALGNFKEALKWSEEAITLYRQLMIARPDAYRAHLATSLKDRAKLLRAVGDYNDALTAASEAANILRTAAVKYPDAYLPELGRSLQTLGAVQASLGKHEDALTSTAEAAQTFDRLALLQPDTYLPDLASCLGSRGVIDQQLGQYKAAAASLERAVTIFRQLVLTKPDKYAMDLAKNLSNLSAVQTNDLIAALSSAEEAVALLRQAADKHVAFTTTTSFRSYLAASLNNLGNRQAIVGLRRQSFESMAEAVKLIRELRHDLPNAFTHDLAKSLSNLGSRQRALGDNENAVTSMKEAIALLRDLAQPRPETFKTLLAHTLIDLSICQGALGQGADASTAAIEALGLYQDLARSSPLKYMQNLAAALENVWNHSDQSSSQVIKLETVVDSVALLRGFVSSLPSATMHIPARALAILASLQLSHGDFKAASTSATDSIALYRKLEAVLPNSMVLALYDPLIVLGEALWKLGEHGSSLSKIMEAIDILSSLTTAMPSVFMSKYASAVQRLADHLPNVSVSRAMQDVAEFALTQMLVLVRIDRNRFGTRLVTCLAYLADCQEATSQREAAANSREQASALRAILAKPA